MIQMSASSHACAAMRAAKVPLVQGEPDPKQCRATPAGFGDYVDCLAARPECCPHALAFGDGHLCLHAARHEIVARTDSARAITIT